jgi:uncharacterized protein YjbJ (UPF0337 family)
MTEDRIEGGVKKEFGRLQDAMGRARGDIGQQAQGKFNEATGAAQEVAGHVAENHLCEEVTAWRGQRHPAVFSPA